MRHALYDAGSTTWVLVARRISCFLKFSARLLHVLRCVPAELNYILSPQVPQRGTLSVVEGCENESAVDKLALYIGAARAEGK